MDGQWDRDNRRGTAVRCAWRKRGGVVMTLGYIPEYRGFCSEGMEGQTGVGSNDTIGVM